MPRLLLLTLMIGCSNSGPPAKPDASMPDGPPSLTVVSAERRDLLFRYRGPDGEGTAQDIASIPEGARAKVQVVDLSLSPAERRSTGYVQVFDLRTPTADGLFPGRIVPRARLEAELAAAAEAAKPRQAPVTMYSASWCGVCKKARAFLTEKGVAFVEKDVEKTPGAGEELARKAKAAGVQTNGVPVFDVGGKLMSGFDGPRLMAMIEGGG